MLRALVVVTVLALLLAAAGLWLWQWAVARQSRMAAVRHLDAQMKERVAGEAATIDAGRGRAASGLLAMGTLSGDPWANATTAQASAAAARKGLVGKLKLPQKLQGVVTLPVLAMAVVGDLVLCALALALGGGLAAGTAFVVLALLGALVIWMRTQKMKRTLVRQLPGFIDSMVRLITIGNSTHAAFQLSVATTKSPLREYMEGASSLVRAGVDLDQALNQMARNVDIEEMYLLASILGLGVRYGGRADVLLERVAGFMRDREQAEAELVAMSAETRLSAWILGLLPIVVGGAIVMLNPGHFNRMLTDSTGQTLIFSAAGLQLLGVFFLYRLARLA
ncbi:type II secretion system F family protein [Variovorax ginsengisoli]|uniref:Tight adherence protein B n=1 Tax=Variovorax ginsengisoli TaxID=363844 RepID=A0ABT9SEB2_9BURK|nr:type II secretion system F family protein [Variovorax ginsengisoli]MDP9902710.1 tight adherence protein B [Variovorax ginsengisoli]